MTQFKKKPVVIDATQWFKNGDHPEDGPSEREGRVVRYYRRPDMDGELICLHCARLMREHGWIDTLEGGHIVCPGDFIITGVKGERYPCKPDIFAATYEPVSSAEALAAKDAKIVRLRAQVQQWRDHMIENVADLYRRDPLEMADAIVRLREDVGALRAEKD